MVYLIVPRLMVRLQTLSKKVMLRSLSSSIHLNTMGTKDTSKRAYEELLNEGFLETQKGIVYKLLKDLGPSTQKEIEEHYERSTGQYLMLRCRFSALEKDGLIKPTSKRPCSITGKLAYVWEADPETESLERPISKAETIKQFKHLLERIAKAETIQEVRKLLGIDTSHYEAPVLRVTKETTPFKG